MPSLDSVAIRELRARAHTLHPVVAIGQHGLTPAVLHEIDLALLAHELIKVRVFNDQRAEREALLARVCAELGCAPVQHLGKVLIVWRHNPDKAAAKAATPAKAAAHKGGKARVAKRGGPRPKPDPVRERRRSTGTATAKGLVRRGAGRGQPVESVARPPASVREDVRRPRGAAKPPAGTSVRRDERSGAPKPDSPRRRIVEPARPTPRDRYSAKPPRATPAAATGYGTAKKPRPVSKRRPPDEYEAFAPRERHAGKPPRPMTTAGPRGYDSKSKTARQGATTGKPAAGSVRKAPAGRPPRHDPLSSSPPPRRRKTAR